MKNTITKTVKSKEELYIEFSDEEMEKMGLKPHDKFSVETEGETLILKKFESIDLNLEDFDKETLAMLVEESINKQVPADEIIRELLEEFLKTNPSKDDKTKKSSTPSTTTPQEVELGH